MRKLLRRIKKAVKDFLNWLGDELSGLTFGLIS